MTVAPFVTPQTFCTPRERTKTRVERGFCVDYDCAGKVYLPNIGMAGGIQRKN